jgi:hypothetical protein
MRFESESVRNGQARDGLDLRNAELPDDDDVAVWCDQAEGRGRHVRGVGRGILQGEDVGRSPDAAYRRIGDSLCVSLGVDHFLEHRRGGGRRETKDKVHRVVGVNAFEQSRSAVRYRRGVGAAYCSGDGCSRRTGWART